jgi:phage shock protein PspC (stress-responsive transcriptional regulator)
MAQTTDTQERAGVNRPQDGAMVRPQEGRVIAGVALALADRLGMSPGAIRLILFILGFFGGLGVLLYIAGWLLIPEEGAPQSIAEDVLQRLGDSTTWLGAVLILIAGVTLVTMLGWVRADLAAAVALLAAGVLLYRGNLDTAFGFGQVRGDEPVASEPEASSSEAPEPPTDAPVKVMDVGVAEQPPRRRRERSILGRLTMGIVFVTLGVMAILDTSEVIRPAFSDYMAVAVGLVGIGLLVGSVFGRSRALIVIGFLLVPILLVSSVVTARFSGGWGDRAFRPATISEVADQYRLTGGDLEIDLGGLELGSEVLNIESDLGFGRLVVTVPQGVAIDVVAHVGFGDLVLFGDRDAGVDIDRTARSTGEGLIVLDLDVGFGELEIREVSR